MKLLTTLILTLALAAAGCAGSEPVDEHAADSTQPRAKAAGIEDACTAYCEEQLLSCYERTRSTGPCKAAQVGCRQKCSTFSAGDPRLKQTLEFNLASGRTDRSASAAALQQARRQVHRAIDTATSNPQNL